ncbi:MAG: hypothetical protein WAV31_02465 [Candidatus Moraniibacteriota bacterium]
MMQSNLAQTIIEAVKHKKDLTPEEEGELKNALDKVEKDFEYMINKDLEWAEDHIKDATRKYDIYTDKVLKKILENLAKSYY